MTKLIRAFFRPTISFNVLKFFSFFLKFFIFLSLLRKIACMKFFAYPIRCIPNDLSWFFENLKAHENATNRRIHVIYFLTNRELYKGTTMPYSNSHSRWNIRRGHVEIQSSLNSLSFRWEFKFWMYVFLSLKKIIETPQWKAHIQKLKFNLFF